MNGKEEIRTTINSINERIAFLIDRFILTDEIKQLMERRETIRATCPHEYINGKCKWCDKQEEKE